ncbi:hypothetical protein BH18CHL2_BH18CHL2_02590 [soil metagenome]
MATEFQALIAEAEGLGLFKPHGAFEVHCSNCHTRLNGTGDCANCGLIGRPAADLESRALIDPPSTEAMLRGAIEKRKAYKPVRGKGSREADA